MGHGSALLEHLSRNWLALNHELAPNSQPEQRFPRHAGFSSSEPGRAGSGRAGQPGSGSQAALTFPLGLLASDVLCTAAASILRMIIPEPAHALSRTASPAAQGDVGASERSAAPAASIVAQTFPGQAPGGIEAAAVGAELPALGARAQSDARSDVAASVALTAVEVRPYHAFPSQSVHQIRVTVTLVFLCWTLLQTNCVAGGHQAHG